MLKQGDVVVAKLPGAKEIKLRPAVVLSTDVYLAQGQDVVLGELTTQLAKATAATDYHLLDWAAAGLHQPSAFRVYLGTVLVRAVKKIGQLADRDWQEVQARLRLGLAVT